MEGLTFNQALLEDEVFLVVPEEEGGGVNFFRDTQDVDEHLSTLTPSVDSGARVIHGVLTKAAFIPIAVSKSQLRATYIICSDLGSIETAGVIESRATNAKELVLEIKQIIDGDSALEIIPDIDDLYVFYGYEIRTKLSINEDDIDDESLTVCQEMAEKAKEVEDRLLEKEDEEYAGDWAR